MAVLPVRGLKLMPVSWNGLSWMKSKSAVAPVKLKVGRVKGPVNFRFSWSSENCTPALKKWVPWFNEMMSDQFQSWMRKTAGAHDPQQRLLGAKALMPVTFTLGILQLLQG